MAGYATVAQHLDFVDFLLDIIPTSVGDAFARGNILQVILFGVLFGMAPAQFRERAKPLVDMLDLFLHGMFGIVRMVMWLAPIATSGAMAFTVGRYGLGSVVQLAAEVWALSVVFVLVVLGLIARVAGFSLLAMLRLIREAVLITFGTSSWEAVLPQLMAKMERLGCAQPIVGMGMPAGYTFARTGPRSRAFPDRVESPGRE